MVAKAKTPNRKTRRSTLTINIAANPTMERLTFNVTGVVRHDQLEGRDYLVVPMVMLTEGVHAGSNGPLLYTANEMKKVPAVWDCKPIVVYHPTDNEGNGISACQPTVINASKVGLIMNTKYKKGKLHAEAWVEVSRLEAVDRGPEILAAIEADEMMELSTGLFTDNEKAPADSEWNGEAYDAIARNFRPDHLAILPGKVGACSIEDGAGFLRLNESQAPEHVKRAVKAIANNELKRLTANGKSFGDVTTDLYNLIDKKFYKKATALNPSISAWVQDVYDKFFIYSYDGKLYKQSYAVDASDETSLVGDEVEVKRVSEYRTLDGAFVGNMAAGESSKGKDAIMTVKELVDGLISNAATQWGEADRVMLLSFNEATLTKMTPVAVTPATNGAAVPPAAAAAPAPATNAAAPAAPAQAPIVAQLAATPSWNEMVANAPAEYQEAMTAGISALKREKDGYIATITGNAANKFSAAALGAMKIDDLQNLAALAGGAAAPAPHPFDASLQGAPRYGAASPAPTGNAQAGPGPALVMAPMSFK